MQVCSNFVLHTARLRNNLVPRLFQAMPYVGLGGALNEQWVRPPSCNCQKEEKSESLSNGCSPPSHVHTVDDQTQN